ncbi:MAG: hypothetical protein KIS77_08710 [Saprospiraceae bacterium]|nr:hypothetical protein [Saprospiraceae bacterium]
MKNKSLAHLLLALLLSVTGLYAQKNWVFQKEKEGVKVYKRKVDDGYELKLVAVFNAAPAAMLALFNNVAEYPKWGYRVAHSELLKRVSATEFYYYSRFSFPWPLEDRDVVMRTTITTDAKTNAITLSSHAVPDFIPEKQGIVRVKKANVTWKLSAQTSTSMEGEYYLSTHPGGILPDWTVNLANDTGPIETVQKMKKLLSEERYKNVKQLSKSPHLPD